MTFTIPEYTGMYKTSTIVW